MRDIESTLDNVVFLYGYISEKDVFERSDNGAAGLAHTHASGCRAPAPLLQCRLWLTCAPFH